MAPDLIFVLFPIDVCCYVSISGTKRMDYSLIENHPVQPSHCPAWDLPHHFTFLFLPGPPSPHRHLGCWHITIYRQEKPE